MKRFFEPWAENAPEWRTPTRGGWQHSSGKTDHPRPQENRTASRGPGRWWTPDRRSGPPCGLGVSDLRGKEAPRVRNALEFVLAALAERDAGARDEILDRAGDQDFVGTRQGTDASGDVDGETGEIVAADF